MAREKRTPPPCSHPRPDGQRREKHRATADSNTLEEQCHPRKVFIGGLAHKTTTQHLRDYFGRFGSIVDAVVLRWPDGRSRGFGYVTFADAVGAESVLRETHMLSGREVDVKRAVPGTNKLFIGGLPQNTTANELREHFEKLGIVSDAVVMIDPTTSRSRGFGFVCFLPGHEGAAAVAAALQQYDSHRIRGKWIEVKSAAPPHKLDAKGGGVAQDGQPASLKAPKIEESETRDFEEISIASALHCNGNAKPSRSRLAEKEEPRQPMHVKLGSPRKVNLPTRDLRNTLPSPSGFTPVGPPELGSTQLPWWTPNAMSAPYSAGFGASMLPLNSPLDSMGNFRLPVMSEFMDPPPLFPGASNSSAAEGLQRNLELFLGQTLQNKLGSGAGKGTPSDRGASVSTTCSAATHTEIAASLSVDN